MEIFMALTKPADCSPTLGCDPEFFLKKGTKIIGSELVIAEDGLKVGSLFDTSTDKDNRSKFVRDGVQAELNPRQNTCRASLASEISACMRVLNGELVKHKVKADFSRLVKITKPELLKLSEKSRVFGCAPSMSIYGEKIDIGTIDPMKYRKRAAGGHLHIGHGPHYGKNTGLYRAVKEDYERTVAMLDIICGNTLVLVDRDKGNIERRKVYGRAGEYRLPPHGLEYRTPSNFWLTSQPLLSLTFGLARLAVFLMADEKRETYYKAFTEAVDMRLVQQAINTNDFKLAMANFKAIEKLLIEVTGDGNYGRMPIHKNNIAEFYHFVDVIAKEGMDAWFPDDVINNWIETKQHTYIGFNDFLALVVRPALAKLNKPVKAG
jgi:hypothetical protein